MRPILATAWVLALAWAMGLAAAAHTGGELAASIAAAALVSLGAFLWRPKPATLAVLPLAAALVFIALVRYEATIPEPDPDLVSHFGEDVELRGVVADEPQERTTSRLFPVDVRDIRTGEDWATSSGTVLVRVPSHSRYGYGDLIELKGELEQPDSEGAFDYQAYLLREGITAVIAYPDTSLISRGHGSPWKERQIDARSTLSDALDDALPQPQSSLAAGVLFGARDAIPAGLRADMAATGTSHLVAVSGQNVSLLAGLIIAAFAWLIGRRYAACLALGGIVGYTLLVGLDDSILRAAIMGALFVVASLLGRQNTTWIAILWAAAIMTAIDPQAVQDVAFQLSFAATLGLVTLSPLLARQLTPITSRFSLSRPLTETLAVTLAAIAFTLPITALTFERVSLIAPIANLFAIPAFLAVAATSALAAALTLAVPQLDWLAAWIAWPPATYMITVIEFFAALPGASISVSIPMWIAVAWYAALGGIVWLFAKRPDYDIRPALPTPGLRLAPALGLAAPVVALVALGWLALGDEDDRRLEVKFLDVGQGDAILIESPDGHRVLVDGGPAAPPIASALGRNLPFYDRRIDLVVVTHPDVDHLGGLLEVLQEYDVGAVLASPLVADTALYDTWLDALEASDIPATTADAGQTVALGGGATIETLWPDADDPLLPTRELNDGSTVLRLDYGDASFLLTADITEATEETLVRADTHLDVDVLKVAHHGSAYSSSPNFLTAASPAISVISSGESNQYGHPAQETLDRVPGRVFRTDEDGDVTIETDGKQIWVKTQR
jgi:competence protein ComEC